MCKVPAFAVAAAFLLIIVSFSLIVSASVSVGVKQGDWIEYNVVILPTESAGTAVSISSDHNITWARMEIIRIQGTQINLSMQTKYANGTIAHENVILDLAAGKIGDDFIIPANLNVGDSFFDETQGNITITGIGQRDVAGVQRTVISAATTSTFYTWDQATGILLSAHTTLTDYTLTTTTNKTNLPQSPSSIASPQETPHSDPQLPPTPMPTFLIVAVIVVLILVGAVVLLYRYSRAGKPQML